MHLCSHFAPPTCLPVCTQRTGNADRQAGKREGGKRWSPERVPKNSKRRKLARVGGGVLTAEKGVLYTEAEGANQPTCWGVLLHVCARKFIKGYQHPQQQRLANAGKVKRAEIGRSRAEGPARQE